MVKSKPILRTRTVSTKLTEEEFAAVEGEAAESGVNLSEWVRNALLDRLKPDERPDNETLLAEVMAVRTIVINLAGAQARGQTMSQERIQELIDHADRERFRRAEERVSEAAKRRKRQREKPGGDGAHLTPSHSQTRRRLRARILRPQRPRLSETCRWFLRVCSAGAAAASRSSPCDAANASSACDGVDALSPSLAAVHRC